MQEEEEEIWKDIEGFEGERQVSNLGRVKRLAYSHPLGNHMAHRPEKIASYHRYSNGYLYVCFKINNKRYKKLVHRLVAKAFIPNPDNLPYVIHIDKDKTNNKVSNLKWSSMEEAIQRSPRKKIDPEYEKFLIELRKANVYKKSVLQYDLDRNFIREWDSYKEILKIYKKHSYNINRCCLHLQKSSNGYIWEFKYFDDCYMYWYDKIKRKNMNFFNVLQYNKDGEFIREWKRKELEDNGYDYFALRRFTIYGNRPYKHYIWRLKLIPYIPKKIEFRTKKVIDLLDEY